MNAVDSYQVDPAFEGLDGGPGSLVKWNPLSNVSGTAVWSFLRTMDVPVNALHFKVCVLSDTISFRKKCTFMNIVTSWIRILESFCTNSALCYRVTYQLGASHAQGLYCQGNMKEKADGGGRMQRPRNVVFTRLGINLQHVQVLETRMRFVSILVINCVVVASNLVYIC